MIGSEVNHEHYMFLTKGIRLLVNTEYLRIKSRPYYGMVPTYCFDEDSNLQLQATELEKWMITPNEMRSSGNYNSRFMMKMELITYPGSEARYQKNRLHHQPNVANFLTDTVSSSFRVLQLLAKLSP